MDPILIVALVGKALVEGLGLVQQLQAQHAQGEKITEQQALALRDAVKALQTQAEDEWAKA